MKRITTVVGVETAALPSKGKAPILYPVGNGLYLQVSSGGGRSWVFRFRRVNIAGGRLRSMGLGSYPSVGLKEAKDRAVDARRLLDAGKDPIAERPVVQDVRTFRHAAEAFIAAKASGWRGAKEKGQWETALAEYAYPVIGAMAVAAVDTPHVLQVVAPIWQQKPQTASRLRGRIEMILGYATALRWRYGANPATWRGNLAHLLSTPSKVKPVRHHPAMDYRDLPALVGELGEDAASQALLFTILTASRTGEVRLAVPSEFSLDDPDGPVWTIPVNRLKRGTRAYRRPLAPGAADIIRRQLGAHPYHPYVFAGERPLKPIGHNAMLHLLQALRPGMTPHGLRASFRTWIAEQTSTPFEVAELALGHVTSDGTVEAAYQRGDLLQKRRALAEAWAEFIFARFGGNVVQLRRD